MNTRAAKVLIACALLSIGVLGCGLLLTAVSLIATIWGK
jgi:hypothetical protein